MRAAGPTILAVSPVGEAGGAEILLLDVLVGLRRQGLAVALVALGAGPLAGVAESRGVTVLPGPSLSFRSPRSIAGAVAAVRRAVGSIGPDVVLASHPKGQLVSRLATAGDRSIGHVTQLYDPPDRSASTRLAARLGGLRLSITEETAAAYRALDRRTDPAVIAPGTDADRLREEARRGDGQRAWADAGLDGTGPRIVMTARLQRFKGPFDFLTVAEAVLRARPDARFLVIGPDSPIEPALRDEITAAIDDRGLRRSVALAGRLAADDLAATVAGASLLVHPAHREPFGLAVVEALTLGTPAVAYATAGPAGILRTGAGALVPVGDTQALGEVVLRALDEPDLLSRWKAEALTTARRFELGTTVDRYRDVLSNAAPSARSSATGPVTTIGVAPAEASGVRDYGLLLGRELEDRGLTVHQHWLDNGGDRARPALRISARLVVLGLTLPRRERVIWHYSPVAYGYRGLPGPGVLVGAVLRARGCRVVCVLHELAYTYRAGADPARARVKALAQQVALRAVLAGSDEVVVTTDRRAAALAGARSGRRPPVCIIPVFPTIPLVPQPGDGAPERAGGPLVLGVPGYAGDGVRADVLLEALPLIGPVEDVRVVLIGAPGAESPDGRRWSALASEHGVERSLEFTGVVDAAEFSRRLAQSTVVVLVNEEGPSSRKTSLAAALAHGRPVVSVDGYNRWDELIEAGAVRVVPCDPRALASSVAGLRDAPAEREALGAQGAAFAEARMSLSGAGDAFVELLGCGAQAGTATPSALASSSVAATAGRGRSNQPSSSQGSGATA